jgi:ribosomal protein S18 acetylase RimI-like enzyme
VNVLPLTAGDLERVRPLWLELHHHHQAIAPELAPYVSDAASWPVRRALYEHVLEAGGFGLIANEDGADVAYAMAAVEPAPWPATFAAGDEIAELLTLAVRPGLRGRGVGTRLLEAVFARFADEGRDDRVIGVIPGNARAAALYTRHGYVPTWLTLTRFGRPRATEPAARRAAVERVQPSEIDALAPLWHALHRHHQAVAPDLGPFVPHDASWTVVRPLLETAARDGLLLRAGPPATPLAMACVTISRDDPLWADTWVTGRTVAETKLLVADDDARGDGLGSALLDAIDERLAAAGVHDQVIGAIEPNAAAIRLYERRGFRPAWLQLTRFEQRGVSL